MIIGIVGSHDIALFRGWLMRDLRAMGHEVVGFCPDLFDVGPALRKWGAEFCPISLDRTGLNPFQDASDAIALSRQLRARNVDLVLTLTTKANVIGLAAASLAGIRRRFVILEGLGYAFTAGDEVKRRIVRQLVFHAYRRSLQSADAVFVLNGDDRTFVRDSGLVDKSQRLVQIAGTGIDLDEFSYSRPDEGVPRVLLIARLLREKGIAEFVEAARLVKDIYPDSTFQLLGRFDSNPGAIGRELIDRWQQEGLIEYLGETSDVRPFLRACNVFCLPTYYREGMPRTILEAMSIGRAIVTTNNTGCRETVVEGVNGFLVEPRDPAALAKAIGEFARRPRKISEFGEASRALAEARFDARKVNRRIMSVMGLCPADESASEVSSHKACPAA